MSLESLTSRDEITLKRLSTTRGTAGGQARTYMTAARGILPTTWTCRRQPLTDDERREYGIRGDRKSFKYLGTTDPSVTVQDAVAYGSETDERVISPSRDLDQQGRIWMVITERVSNEA
jgi:hypothetical protein